MRGDPFESHDPVFGVKASLIVDLSTVDDATATKYDVKPGTKLLEHQFVLTTVQEAAELRRKEAVEIMGSDVKFTQGRPFLATS